MGYFSKSFQNCLAVWESELYCWQQCLTFLTWKQWCCTRYPSYEDYRIFSWKILWSTVPVAGNQTVGSEHTKLKILFSVQFREHKAKNIVLQFLSKCHSCPHDHQIAKYRTKYKTGELGWDTKDLSCEICISIFRSYIPTFLQFLVILVICMTLFASKSWSEWIS